MTSKFKVGDKVEVVGNKHGGWAVGTVGKITGITKGFPPINVEKDGDVWYHTEDELELFSPKLTKNQRITALEETVAKQGEEIAELKLIVGQIRQPSTVVQESLTTATSSVEDKPQTEGERLVKQCEQHFPPQKSANQLRAEMIEKAKAFVDENGGDDYHFDIDEKEGTVFAYKVTISGVGRYGVKYGFSKCHPNDVFNADIGKAISFGRAEKKDVSEFEQAVQPSHYAVGQIGINWLGTNYPFEIIKIGVGEVFKKNFEPYTTSIGDTTKPLNFKDENHKSLTIINDTNAIYSEVK